MQKKHSIINRIFIILVILFLLCCSLVFAFNIVYEKTKVSGYSMYPTLNYDENANDRVYINLYNKGKVGDIVVADVGGISSWSGYLDQEYIIKRYIANSGDKVKMECVDGKVYNLIVNDQIVFSKTSDIPFNTYNKYLEYCSNNSSDNTRIDGDYIIIKDGEVFLMGDNWDRSYDCMSSGPIPKNTIVGRVDIIVPKSENLFFGIIKDLFNIWF